MSAVFATDWVSFFQLDFGVAFTAKILCCGVADGGSGGSLRLKGRDNVSFARHDGE